jgi:cytidine deaminase
MQLTDDRIAELSRRAWAARDNSRILGETKVGCAVLDERGSVFVGCNVEHRFRSHDIHAEVSAISAMVTAGGNELVAVFIAAEREKFTPCGACLDWIFELGGGRCLVFSQASPSTETARYTALELMPHYPR